MAAGLCLHLDTEHALRSKDRATEMQDISKVISFRETEKVNPKDTCSEWQESNDELGKSNSYTVYLWLDLKRTFQAIW